MKQKSYSRIFYVEAFILLFFFLAVIVIVSRVLVTAKSQSLRAADMTNAVILAENAAQIAGRTDDPEELAGLLGEAGARPAAEGAAVSVNGPGQDGVWTYVYSADTDADRAQPRYFVEVRWDSEPRGSGALVNATVTVSLAADAEELYELDSASFIGQEGGRS